jgi:hypothetical protein
VWLSWKKEAPSALKQMSLVPISFLVKPPCYMRDWTIVVVTLFTFPPSKTCWSVNKIFFPCMHHIHMYWKQDWISIVIISSTLKERKLGWTTTIAHTCNLSSLTQTHHTNVSWDCQNNLVTQISFALSWWKGACDCTHQWLVKIWWCHQCFLNPFSFYPFSRP